MKEISLEDYREISRLAKKRSGYNLPIGKKENIKGFIWIKIKNFKKVGFRMELDFPFDISKEKIRLIKLFLENILNDIETPGFKEELHVGKSSIIAAFYKNTDEIDILKTIFYTLSNSETEFFK